MIPTIEVIYTDIQNKEWKSKRKCIHGFPTSNEVVATYNEMVYLFQEMHKLDYMGHEGVNNPVTED